MSNIKANHQHKRPNWLRRVFSRWVDRAYHDLLVIRNTSMDGNLVEDLNSELTAKSCIRFTIYPASGGHVIQYYKSDIKSSSHDGPSLVIVARGEDIGKAVEHIIAIETLRS